jgi:polysaccharide biosynthesis protein VpsQ
MQRRPDAWGGSQTRPKLFKMKWITALFALFIILIIILADRGQLGILKLVNQIPYGDKAGHFILYGILTLLIDLTLFRALPLRSPKPVAVISGLTLALLIGLEEFSQQYFASRTFSLRDLFASYLGVIFFTWLALRIKR